MATYFVTENYIKTATTVSNNVSAQALSPLLAPSTDMFIKRILRQADHTNSFYDYLLAKYIAQTLTADEIVLVSYIKPALAWRVAANATSSLFAAITNKGPQLQSGDNSASVSDNSLYYLINDLTKMSEFYQQELVEFLRLNKSLYPTFTGSYCDGGLNDQFDSGVALYREGCTCNRYYGGACGCGYYQSY